MDALRIAEIIWGNARIIATKGDDRLQAAKHTKDLAASISAAAKAEATQLMIKLATADKAKLNQELGKLRAERKLLKTELAHEKARVQELKENMAALKQDLTRRKERCLHE